ncbi:hypothetical protein BV898_05088 [Hypsibius exemplaris]|uniref:Uncharacterized protein n=1 Tax=Hypsibius exemplaris TaxID=2072580 RepID=A0A1W0X0N2_HYPEX|nr:hypothetical protein BV898_05088 [Hypsibius exemplaris]
MALTAAATASSSCVFAVVIVLLAVMPHVYSKEPLRVMESSNSQQSASSLSKSMNPFGMWIIKRLSQHERNVPLNTLGMGDLLLMAPPTAGLEDYDPAANNKDEERRFEDLLSQEIDHAAAVSKRAKPSGFWGARGKRSLTGRRFAFENDFDI